MRPSEFQAMLKSFLVTYFFEKDPAIPDPSISRRSRIRSPNPSLHHLLGEKNDVVISLSESSRLPLVNWYETSWRRDSIVDLIVPCVSSRRVSPCPETSSHLFVVRQILLSLRKVLSHTCFVPLETTNHERDPSFFKDLS